MQNLIKIIVCISFLFSCKAQQQTAIPEPPLANTLLWEISGKGINQPSYLFGTMHLVCADDARMSDSLKIAVDKSNAVFLEINMDDMSQMLGALKYIRMNGNKRLKDLLSASDYEKVKTYFDKNPSILPLSMMESFKPFFIASLLSEQTMPCPPSEGMEQVIMKEAKLKKKKIQGLETVAFQASIFDSIPYELQAKELVKMIEGGNEQDKESIELLNAYRNQDLQKIQEFTLKEDGLITKNLDLLLFNRNARWAKQIDSMVQNKTLLFAVGAAHLPGERGVIRLLQKQGYIMRPMKN
jgi:uncharacterized protein YbaP (TraB family)